VFRHYHDMRSFQTLAFARRMAEKHHGFDHRRMTVWAALDALDDYVDASDPDTSLPNKVHMLQTAYRARDAGKPDWVQVVALIHDIGKLMFLWGSDADGQGLEHQYALAGDTWVVGHPLPDELILSDLNALNPDMADPVLGAGTGIYEPGCGLERLEFAYGHDEYLYRFLIHNEARMAAAGVPHAAIPREGLAMARYHSAYPVHSSSAYEHLYAAGDAELVAAVREFNQFDLYTKADAVPDYESAKVDFAAIVEKYLPGELEW